jgi:hypothetical protein
VSALLEHATGLPEELRKPELTGPLADVIAATVVTFDGNRYREVSIQGNCAQGVLRCELAVSGLPSFAASWDEQDTYRFLVVDSSVSAQGDPQRRGFPAILADELDRIARSNDQDGLLSDLPLLGIEWLPAPPADAYLLRYGRGNEEGDPTVMVRLDRQAGRILSIHIEP